jgi:hypothetical protein
MNDVPIQLSTTEDFIIPPKQLEAYQAYVIELTGSRMSNGIFPSKSNSVKISLIVTELDLPVLEVDVPEYLLSRKINLNENIRLTLKYPNADPD